MIILAAVGLLSWQPLVDGLLRSPDLSDVNQQQLFSIRIHLRESWLSVCLSPCLGVSVVGLGSIILP